MLNVIKWRIKIYLNNKVIIALFLIIPIILTLWMAEDINKKGLGQMIVNIIDEDVSEFSKDYIEKIKRDESITTVQIPYEEGLQEIKKEKISAMILIKDGFSKNILEGKNKDLIELVYLKDNYYVSSFSDVFVHHYFSYIAKYRNINYVLSNYGNLVDEEEYIKKYENNYEELNNSDSYKYEFSLVEVDSGEEAYQDDNNIILYRYLLGIIFLLSYILILIQSIEFQNNKKGIVKKLKLSGIKWFINSTGNVIGTVAPTFVILSTQLTLVNLIINKSFSFNIILYTLLFSFSATLITVVIVKIFKKSEKLYLMIPYYILVLWIFGDVLFNLEFISFLDIERNLIPGIGIKGIITSFIMRTNIDILSILYDEIIYILLIIIGLGIIEYKEFKNAAS